MLRLKLHKLSPGHDLIGIELNNNRLKLVQVKTYAHRKEIVNLLARDIGGLSDTDIAKVIRDAVVGLKIKLPTVIHIVPSQAVITKNIEIPSIDDKEIKEIIGLQAGRHTPYSREEIIIDYIDIGTHKHSYTKILLVIVARNLIQKQFEILERAGFKVEHMLLSAEGLARLACEILKLESDDSPRNIVHIDENSTDFTIVFKHKVIFIRSISIGAQLLVAEKEKYQVRFMEELKRSLEAYQSEDIDKIPNAVILTGAVEELKDLEEALNNNFHVPTRIAPYFRNLAVSPELLKSASLFRRLSFLDVIAPLLCWQELKVDLVPEEIKLRIALQEQGKELIKTGILILAIFVLTFSVLISKIYFKGAYLRKLNLKYESLNKETQILETEFAKAGLIKTYLADRGYSLEVLTELYTIASDDLEIGDIRFDSQGKFSIRGTAESMSGVFSFVENLEKSKYFKDVKAKYTTKRKVGLRDLTDFEVVSALSRKDE